MAEADPQMFVEQRKAAQPSTPCILHTSLNGMVTMADQRFETLNEAGAALDAFKAAHRTDKLASAAIWNVRALRFADQWIGGVKFGPADKRHPLAKLYGDAIRAGRRVTIIGDGHVMKFNQGAQA